MDYTISDLGYKGVELIYELPVNFKIYGDDYFSILIRYREDPSLNGYRGWRELEAIRTTQYWIDKEKGFIDGYISGYLKETFKIEFLNKKLLDKEQDQFCNNVLVELKKIMHERKIEIPGYTIESSVS